VHYQLTMLDRLTSAIINYKLLGILIIVIICTYLTLGRNDAGYGG